MNKVWILVITIISIIFSSGCLDIGVLTSDSETKLVGTPFDESLYGSGYLEEGAEEILFELPLGDFQYLIHMRAIINWEDEPPVDRSMAYHNEGDTFSVRITGGEHINHVSSNVNAEYCEGRTYVNVEGDLVQNDSISRPLTFRVVVKLIHCGDQYPLYYRSEAMKVEDEGNDYTWTVEYRYVEK